jgi:beta-dihydromenaquinone-9 omega-hydroxylase
MVAERLNPTRPCTTDESLATQDATALIGKLASRRMRARLGFPATATMRRDVQLARARAPMLAEVLALTAARKARSRLVGNDGPKHVQITDFDPLDPAIARDPYPHYRELLAGERVQYCA